MQKTDQEINTEARTEAGAEATSELVSLGRVVKTEPGFAYVLTQRDSGCSGCQSEKGCGTSTLAKLFAPESKAPLKIQDEIGVKTGDQVVLTLDESHLIKHSFMAYGLPLLGMFVFAGLFQVLLFPGIQNDLPAVLGAIIGLAGGWWFTQRVYKPVQPSLKEVVVQKDLTV